MSIEILGDVTQEQYEHYCKNHTHVIINGRIITKEEELAKEKAEQERVQLEKQKALIVKGLWCFGFLVFAVCLTFL